MKKLILACVCILAASAAFSLTVDVSEISKAKAIRFENHTVRAVRSDSPVAVAAIGTGLASDIIARPKTAATYHNKYTVIHAVSPDEPEKL